MGKFWHVRIVASMSLTLTIALGSPGRTEPKTKSSVASTQKNNEEESEGPQKTFTDKIKNIRSVDGEYDVFFVKHFGPYSVPYSLPNSSDKDLHPEEILKEAFKRGLDITVTVDNNTDTLISVDSVPERQPAATSVQDVDLPADLDYLKDIVQKASKTSGPSR